MTALLEAEEGRRLAALTRTYVFNAMESPAIKFIRRAITRNGGVFHECYRYPGVYWVATFRDEAGRDGCTKMLIDWLNKTTREIFAADLVDGDPYGLLYDMTFGTECQDPPVSEFMLDVWITDERKIERLAHPMKRF